MLAEVAPAASATSDMLVAISPLLVDTSINSSLGRVTDVYICGGNLGPNATFTPVPAGTSTPTGTSTVQPTTTPVATSTPTGCQAVTWTNLVNVTATGNTITANTSTGSGPTAAALSLAGTTFQRNNLYGNAAPYALYVADTNNHLIRTIDVASGKVATLTIAGLEAPGKQALAGQ